MVPTPSLFPAAPALFPSTHSSTCSPPYDNELGSQELSCLQHGVLVHAQQLWVDTSHEHTRMAEGLLRHVRSCQRKDCRICPTLAKRIRIRKARKVGSISSTVQHSLPHAMLNSPRTLSRAEAAWCSKSISGTSDLSASHLDVLTLPGGSGSEIAEAQDVAAMHTKTVGVRPIAPSPPMHNPNKLKPNQGATKPRPRPLLSRAASWSAGTRAGSGGCR
mmetsp:Transcript_21306/g.45696  ORF Transcript_21306/g.45696 Transcript_21306/m.45696 type:complete len:218 (+) Transcript_21306:88-741(+)